MKFKTENEFALKVIDVISKIIAPEPVFFVCEVPTSKSGRVIDLLIILPRKKRLTGVEFKLNSARELACQVQNGYITTGLNVIGITHTKPRKERQGIYPVTGFTGPEIATLKKLFKPTLTNPAYTEYHASPYSRLFWWGFMDRWECPMFSDLGDMCRPYAKGLGLFELFKRAVNNLFTDIGKPASFDMVYPLVGGMYSESTARGYYREVRAEWKIGIEKEK